MYVCYKQAFDTELVLITASVRHVSVTQVSEPVMEDTGSFFNDVLDDIDLSDPAAVTSSVSSMLSVLNPIPARPSVNT